MAKSFSLGIFGSRLSKQDHHSDAMKRGEMSRENTKTIGVYWLQPALMVLYLILGLLTAVAHHIYYFSLHNRRVYAEDWQQWPIRIGAGLSFLTASLFNMAVGAAYTQYVWTRLRNKSFSLLDIDGLFSLTTNTAGFFSKGIITRAKSVVVIAAVSWLLPIATTIPPATLAVSSVIVPFITQTSVPTLQTNVNKWTTSLVATPGGMRYDNQLYWEPTVYVRQIVARATVDGVIGDIPSLAPNSTYSIQFPGPALECNLANAVQQPLFDHHRTDGFQLETVPWDLGDKPFGELLVYSSFSPSYAPEHSLSPNMVNSEALKSTGETGLQLWIQTPEQKITCLQGFAYFSATFSWTNGIPNHQTTRLNFTTDTSDELGWRDRVSAAVFDSLLGMINGSITITHKLETTGNFMLTGLRGCDEIVNNHWIRVGQLSRVSQNQDMYYIGDPGRKMIASFPSAPFLCRNKTLAAALEDLSNNITMSLLGSELTSQNDTLTNVLFTPSELVYTYDPVNLIVTHAVVGLVALAAVMFGFAALDENGIAHSLTFSAIMDATRSPDLAAITNDRGFGMMPLNKNAETTKLKFGVLKGVKEGDSHRVGFVLAEGDEHGKDVSITQ